MSPVRDAFRLFWCLSSFDHFLVVWPEGRVKLRLETLILVFTALIIRRMVEEEK